MRTNQKHLATGPIDDITDNKLKYSSDESKDADVNKTTINSKQMTRMRESHLINRSVWSENAEKTTSSNISFRKKPENIHIEEVAIILY